MIREQGWEIGTIAISGPSCSGKSTLEKMLVASQPETFASVISTTTRRPRPGEVQGSDYRFVSRYEFAEYQRRDYMVEWDEFSGHLYGVDKDELKRLQERRKIAVVVVTPKGLEPLRAACERIGKGMLSIYVSAPVQVLMTRLMERYRNDREDQSGEYARRALEMIDAQRDWPRAFDYDIVEEGLDIKKGSPLMGRIRQSLTRCGPWVEETEGRTVAH